MKFPTVDKFLHIALIYRMFSSCFISLMDFDLYVRCFDSLMNIDPSRGPNNFYVHRT